jgi:hypothetical protein
LKEAKSNPKTDGSGLPNIGVLFVPVQNEVFCALDYFRDGDVQPDGRRERAVHAIGSRLTVDGSSTSEIVLHKPI